MRFLPLPLPLALVVVSLFAAGMSSSHSTPHPLPPRIGRIARPSTRSIDILPRLPSPHTHPRDSPDPDPHTLQHHDSFRLVLDAFNDTFYLHLRPNDHLVHPAARITYYTTTPDGRSVPERTIPLLRHTVRAYLGEVIAEHHSITRLREDASHVFPHASHPAVRGWARIMVHDDAEPPLYEGSFSADGVIYHIATQEHYLIKKRPTDIDLIEPREGEDAGLVIWKDSDTVDPARETVYHSCGHDRLQYNSDAMQNAAQRTSLEQPWWEARSIIPWGDMHRRDDVVSGGGNGNITNYASNIGQNDGCPTEQKVLYMGVAADCQYVINQGSADLATTQILNNWNSASALYKSTFNVSLGIVELQVQSSTCPTTPDPSIPWNVDCSTVLDDRLSLFSQWRGQRSNDNIGLWHLMSGCPSGSEVGIAWLSTLCLAESRPSNNSIVSGTAVSTSGLTEWQVVSHEIGHNFGAIHDCTDGCSSSTNCCPFSGSTCDANSVFIMNPISESGEKIFSQCTLGNICSVMKSNSATPVVTTCLVDPDPKRTTISLQMCGNGIVEKGEECDPGRNASSSCCNAATCKFLPNAVCDPSSSACCTSQCEFASAEMVCRPARDAACDTPETCTGAAATCPPDVVANNGKLCGNGGLKCASGQCTSNSLQCQRMGASLGLKDVCPNKNQKSCQVACQDPDNSDECTVLVSLLIDGSPCGYGGSCSAGNCLSGGVGATVAAWYSQNLQIAIPLTMTFAIACILILYVSYRAIKRLTFKPQDNSKY